MVLSVLYLGTDTCENFIKAGLRGQIPDHLCDPLKYYAYEPCGCGKEKKPIKWTVDIKKYFKKIIH